MKRTLLFLTLVAAAVFIHTALAEGNPLLEVTSLAQAQGKVDLDSPLSWQVETPWLEAKEHIGIAYFVFPFPARIERYNLVTETWLTDITLNGTPTAYEVDNDGIYISFGNHTSRFNLDGSGEVTLQNIGGSGLFLMDPYLYIQGGSTITSIDKISGSLVDTADYYYELVGVDAAPTLGKAFARTVGISPSDIVEIILNSDGTLGSMTDSPYHGDYPSATQTYVFPGETKVADDSGIVYNTIALSYTNSLAGGFDGLAFNGDTPVVLRGSTIIAYSAGFLETGRYTPAIPPGDILVFDGEIISFSEGAQGIDVVVIPISQLTPRPPAPAADPNGLAYLPDDLAIGADETLYLLSKDHRNIFRWSVPLRAYLETIPLMEEPEEMAYSGVTNRLYLTHAAGEITQIDLNQSPLAEMPLVNSPQDPCGLATAGEFIFVCDPSGAWESHFTYDPDGSLLSQEEWNYYSDEYIWNAANQKMYFFRDGTSPNDLLWEDIDASGVLGTIMDSPYHSSEGIVHPIRVAPNGSVVVLGSGRVYDALSLVHLDTLDNELDDAAWIGNTLLTLRASGYGSELQKWGNTGVDESFWLPGDPVRMFTGSEGVIVVTYYANRPWFSVVDEDLNVVYQTPIYPLSLPVMLSNYCADFYDSFDNPASGWEVVDDAYVRTEYLAGEFRILTKQEGYYYLFTAPTCSRESYVVEVDGRWVGAPGASYGLIFGVAGDFSSYYLFDINTDYQDFMLVKKVYGNWSVIVPITPSPSILGGNATNHLKIIRDGSYITLEVNGTNVGTWYDADITGLSFVGIVSSPYNGAPTSDARFDNFSVTALPTTAAATHALTYTLPPNHPSGWLPEGSPVDR